VTRKQLSRLVEEYPFPDFVEWWELGATFSALMAESVFSQWFALHKNDSEMRLTNEGVVDYLKVVYGRKMRVSLVEDLVRQNFAVPLQSGEFDALSYAFYKSAFLFIGNSHKNDRYSSNRERYAFTKQVGEILFRNIAHYLDLHVPTNGINESSFSQLDACLRKIGIFLEKLRICTGWLRFYI